MDQGQSRAVEDELKRIEESATDSSQSQFAQAKLWQSVNLLLGLPAALLAAISGGTALAGLVGKAAAAALALGAAGFAALAVTLNASERARQSHAAANAYLGLLGAARRLRTVGLLDLTFAQARDQLDELGRRQDQINESAPIPSRWAFWLGRKNVERGGPTYAVDHGFARPRVDLIGQRTGGLAPTQGGLSQNSLLFERTDIRTCPYAGTSLSLRQRRDGPNRAASQPSPPPRKTP